VIHCGHPTALWPYYVELRDGTCPVLFSTGERLGYGKPPEKGRPYTPKFRSVYDAEDWVLRQQEKADERRSP
jgi:hypothetical protein